MRVQVEREGEEARGAQCSRTKVAGWSASSSTSAQSQPPPLSCSRNDDHDPAPLRDNLRTICMPTLLSGASSSAPPLLSLHVLQPQ